MFIVTKCFSRSEIRVGDFKKQADAEKCIQEKLAEDIRFKVSAFYRLYEGADLLREFQQTDWIDDSGSASSGSSQGSASTVQGARSGSSFSPTPFNAAPRPGGMPHSWVKDDEKDKGEK